jgi:hypothetical protein
MDPDEISRTKAKRYRLTIDGKESQERVEALDSIFCDDIRLIECFILYHSGVDKYYIYLEFNHPKGAPALMKILKKHILEKHIMLKIMKGNKKTLLYSFIKQGLIQKEMPTYFNRNGTDLHEYF